MLRALASGYDVIERTRLMAGGVGVGFVLGLLYASQRRRPVPATLYRVASKEVDAKGLADLALAEVV